MGLCLYADTQTVSVVNGFYSLQVGASNTVGLVDALDQSPVYSQITIGTNVLNPREQVLSSAYAIHAKTAESSETAQSAVTAQNAVTASNYLPLTGGMLTGPLETTSTFKFPSWQDLVCDDSNIEMGKNSYDDYISCVSIGNGARSYSSSRGSVAIGANATARYRVGGVAVGKDADGDYNGVALGYSADGQYTNIAIGFQASAYSGYARTAIGNVITNRKNHTCVIRGNLYLDGTHGPAGETARIFYRDNPRDPVNGDEGPLSGTWIPKAFTIPHPLDPENKLLRHYCLEGPTVWNVYAGNVDLRNGKAEVQLPDYYSALNLEGSEVYSLTPVGGPASLYVQREVADNRFVIGGDQDVKVSWTIKVKRNDPGCLKGLKKYPVEQSAKGMKGHKEWLDSQKNFGSELK